MATTKERVAAAKTAMLNIRGVYELLECGAYVKPEHDGYLRYQLGNMQDIITLHGTEITAAFPWAHIDHDDIAEAYAEIMTEWED